MKKKNASPLKWMLAILVALMAVAYWTNQPPKNTISSQASNISFPNFLAEFFSNIRWWPGQNELVLPTSGYVQNTTTRKMSPGTRPNALGLSAKIPPMNGALSKAMMPQGATGPGTGQGPNTAQNGNNAQPNSESNSGKNSSDIPATNADQRTGNLSGTNSENNPGDNLGSNSGNSPGDNSGNNPGDNSGDNPGDNSGTNPGDNSGNSPGDNSGNNPGNNSGNPGGSSGNNPRNTSGNNPGGSSGSNPGSNQSNNPTNNPSNYTGCVLGCYPGCIPGCDPECVRPQCSLGITTPGNNSGNNPGNNPTDNSVNDSGNQYNLPIINPVPTDTEISQNVSLQNSQVDALSTELASRQALVLAVQQQAQASKYQTISYDSIPTPSTNPTPSDIPAKVQSKQYSFH